MPEAIDVPFVMVSKHSFCPNNFEMPIMSPRRKDQGFEESSLRLKLRRGHGEMTRGEGAGIGSVAFARAIEKD